MITSCKNYSFIYLHLEKTAFSVFDIPAIKKLRQKEIEIDILVNKMMATLNNCSKQFCSLLFFFSFKSQGLCFVKLSGWFFHLGHVGMSESS